MVHRVSHRHGNGHVYADLGPADGLLSGYDRGGTHALHDPLGRIVGISGDGGSLHRLWIVESNSDEAGSQGSTPVCHRNNALDRCHPPSVIVLSERIGVANGSERQTTNGGYMCQVPVYMYCS